MWSGFGGAFGACASAAHGFVHFVGMCKREEKLQWWKCSNGRGRSIRTPAWRCRLTGDGDLRWEMQLRVKNESEEGGRVTLTFNKF